MCSVYAAAVARILGIALVNGMITDSPIIKVGSRKWVRSRLTFPFSDLILANSKAGLLAYKAPPHRSACVYNGFDFNRLKTLVPGEEIRRAHGIKTPKVIGMVANIDRRKDHLNFTRTAIHICNDRSDVSFIAIGEGPLRESCMQMVPEGLRDRIIFPGRRSDVESHVQIFDIGMLLSHREGISNAIIEYMASGKPVIATEGGGTPELVVHGETGFIVASNTEDRVVQYIHYLLDTTQAAEQMGRAGRARIQAHFSTKHMCSETLSIYRSCLRRKTLPRGANMPKGLEKHV
jgi:glycosyltransferase involved in cell wall biosynthesis